MDLETWKIIKNQIRPAEPHLRALLPRNQAGCIMGYKGSVVQRLKFENKVFIEIFQIPGAKWGRVITVRGDHTAQSKVWHDMFNIILRTDPFAMKLCKEYGFHYNFILPSDLVDLFTYEGDFQRIANESGIRILVKHEYLMRSTERVVSFEMRDEKLEGFEKAVLLLAESVAANVRLAMCAPENVFYREQKEDDIWEYMHFHRENDIIYSPRWTQFVQRKSSISVKSDPLPPREDSVSSRHTGSVTSDHTPRPSSSNTTNQSSEQYVTPAMTRTNSAKEKEEEHVEENTVKEKDEDEIEENSTKEKEIEGNSSQETGEIKEHKEDISKEQEEDEEDGKFTDDEEVDNKDKNNVMKEMTQLSEKESTEKGLEEDDENDKFKDNEDDDNEDEDNKDEISLMKETTQSKEREITETDLDEERFHDAEEDIEE